MLILGRRNMTEDDSQVVVSQPWSIVKVLYNETHLKIFLFYKTSKAMAITVFNDLVYTLGLWFVLNTITSL